MSAEAPPVFGLPPVVDTVGGIDQLGRDCRVSPGVTLLRHGSRSGCLIRLGDGVSLFDHNRLVVGDVSINTDACIEIGDRSIVNVGGYLSGEGGLRIGKEVLIGPHVRIFSAGHAIHGGEASIYLNPLTYAGVDIGDGAWIGGGATILPGVTIGRGAVVGAGSIVTEDVPDFAIAVGNPARLLRYRQHHAPAGWQESAAMAAPTSLWQHLSAWWKGR
ncbi:acyltransferase [Undibacterium oligocarboniphilum]|uniref:Acyltransferase n=1 Tax=Undibacterium oligocarboniphilum TaxID=666702 RepID=A0A850QAV6_9BURK|nr:acyltransferase [Undibacterium oligocarboniphilum]MBC3870909.1 acyltransferase [Undibacterium oligocarboniphilum]NVO76468.1 acyltransferase [Undibacterium oligocarboniphilum]